MSYFVLDCSVAMAWCFEDEANEKSQNCLQYLKKSKAVVPSIWSLEVMNVLQVSEKKKRIQAEQSNLFIKLLSILPIEVDLSSNLNKGITTISREYGLTTYDAAYLELAVRKKIPLASLDKLLCRMAKMANVELMLT